MLHFIVPAQFADEVAALPDQTVGKDYPYWLGGRFNWAAQSYMVLRQYREGLTISCEPRPGIRNFAHCMGWRAVGSRQDEYRISVRADYKRLFDVDFELLQNDVAPTSATQAYVPYWPVPGIIPRDAARNGIKRVAYAGRIGSNNLDLALRGKDGPLGPLDLAIIPPDQWHDLSQVDLLIAIRDFSGATHDNKPPSKLFNSWIAGIPLIGGTDSAFSSVGRPGKDFIRVESEAEFSTVLERLRDDPGYYDAIVEGGKERRPEVTTEAIATEWLKVLDGPVQADFERWKELPPSRRSKRVAPLLDNGRDLLSGLKRKLTGGA